MSLRVRPLGFGKAAQPFIDLLWTVYRDDPLWIPPLRRVLSDQLNPKRNPFLQYGTAQLFLAERDGLPVGRISAHLNPVHDQTQGERGGFFGFFEAVNDPAVAQALLETAEDWLAAHSPDWVRGPLSFTMNDEVGCLIDGFDTPPVVGMPHARPYYAALIEGCGYSKVKDLYSWFYDVQPELYESHRRNLEEVHALEEVRIRNLDRKHLQRDVRTAVEIFNDTWAENWGFVPVSLAEADHLTADLAQFVDPRMTFIAEIQGEPAAIMVTIPNLNEQIRDLNGRLFPLGGLKLWWRLRRRRYEGSRTILLGLRKAFRTRRYTRLTQALMAENHLAGIRLGYQWDDLGWVLEDNHLLNTMLPRFGARIYKTYRIYQKSLAAAAAEEPSAPPLTAVVSSGGRT